MQVDWYISRDGESYGPFTRDELRQLIREKRVVSTDFVWKTGMTTWVQGAALSELFPSDSSTSPQTVTCSLRGPSSGNHISNDGFAVLIHDVEQRTPEWFALRRGIPTASQFCKIITSRGSASKQSEAYLSALLAELAGEDRSSSFIGSYWTERGIELEEEAVSCYERETGTRTVKVGFITDRERTMGCSPDRLVGNDGLLEVKCPAPHTHECYLRTQRIDMRYYPQVQGQLLITGRSWVDFLSYDPDRPYLLVRIFRDEPYIATLKELLKKFTKVLDQRRSAVGVSTGRTRRCT